MAICRLLLPSFWLLGVLPVVRLAPGDQPVGVLRIDDTVVRDAVRRGALAAQLKPGELGRSVRVRVDRELTAGLERLTQEVVRRVDALRPWS